MSRFLRVSVIAAIGFGQGAVAQDTLGLGRDALPEEVAAWDIDVRPDGLGLPVGSGDVYTGEEVFVAKCASCHGDFGEAVGRWPVLAGGQGSLQNRDPVKTIGSYWPYLSTVYDYVNRAMPFGESQSLEPDEIYAITAYLLYLNDMVDEDFTLDNENFTEIEMPNAGNFFMDDRAEVEMPIFSAEACMANCKDSVEITMHASVLDVTPQTQDDDAAPAAEPTPVEEAVATVDPALIAAGESVFRQCKACHQVGDGATNRTGPQLNDLVGRTIGGIDGFRYSRGFADAAEAGDVWNDENLAAFLANPRDAMPGTKMSFRGLGDAEDIAAVLAYISQFSE
ncbi:c-type cytochrome [Yoonia sp.]|uniref:c-type cytochrome n=1 Tax=Yoonia sp. TaxID=2212373 RepID=UPI0025EF302D|nr:c-type cytochrome [Yoonia sp.]